METIQSSTNYLPSGNRSWRGRRRGLRKYLQDPGEDRLRGDCAALREEYRAIVDAIKQQDPTKEQPWASRVKRLLNDAESALDQGDIERAWRVFHAAKRVEVYGLEQLGNRQLRAQAQQILNESNRTLGGWRKEAIFALLAAGADSEEDDGLERPLRAKSGLCAEDVIESYRIMHEQYETEDMKRRYLEKQMSWLVYQVGLVTALFILLAGIGSVGTVPFLGGNIPVDGLAFPPSSSEATAELLVYLVLAGILGASIFGINSLKDQSVSTCAPQYIQSFTLTLARIFVGGASALVVYIFLQTGVLNFPEDTPNASFALLAAAFVAGYFERLVPDAAERLAARIQPEDR